MFEDYCLAQTQRTSLREKHSENIARGWLLALKLRRIKCREVKDGQKAR